jgi:hypothetical protein
MPSPTKLLEFAPENPTQKTITYLEKKKNEIQASFCPLIKIKP